MRAIGAARLLRQQDRHHGAKNEGHRRALLGQAADETGRREPRLDHKRRAVQQRLVEAVQRVGVEHRQRRHQHVAVADAEKFAGIDRPPEILRVRTTHALRQPGGAGGVEDRQRIARLDRVRRQPFCRAAGTARDFKVLHVRLLPVADQPQRFKRDALRGQGRQTGVSSRSMTMSRAPQLPRMCFELRAARGGVDRDRDGASQAQPRIVSSSSARLPHMMATRSPGLTPAAASAPA